MLIGAAFRTSIKQLSSLRGGETHLRASVVQWRASPVEIVRPDTLRDVTRADSKSGVVVAEELRRTMGAGVTSGALTLG